MNELEQIAWNMAKIVAAFAGVGLIGWAIHRWKDDQMAQQQIRTERFIRLQESGLLGQNETPDPDVDDWMADKPPGWDRTVHVYAHSQQGYAHKYRVVDGPEQWEATAEELNRVREAHNRGDFRALVLHYNEPPPPIEQPDDDDDTEQGVLEVRTLDGRTLRVPAKPGSAASAPVRCKVCKRILTGKVAIEHELGRTCRRKVKADQAAGVTDDRAGATVQRGVAAAPVPEPDTGAAGNILAPPGLPAGGGEQHSDRPDDARGALPDQHQPQPDPGQRDPAADGRHVPVGAGGVSPAAQQPGQGGSANGATPPSSSLDAAGEREAGAVK